jgi:3-dehydroquinate synthase|tara:strand:+ start:11250 stop:12311 length:1062 start_codon:yes stop_codon:yes gene_type:complete
MTSFFNLKTEVQVGPLSESGLGNLLTGDYCERKKIILVDSNTNENCLPHLMNFLDGLTDAEIIEIPAGEEFKSMDICLSVWESLTEYEFSRNDLFICLGGGMICDLGGFVASLYKRGMDCIYIPTSLLAMVDASIGGKTGIDMGSLKNHLGVFSFPKKVFIDTDFLSTLPLREIKNGWAEMIKHSLIADENHFVTLENCILDNSTIPSQWIETSLLIKHEIVESDPKESGRRKLLNFGHTIGHAIEGSLLNSDNPIDHGLAVAHGMLVEAKISELMKNITSEEFQRIENCIRKTFDLRQFDEASFDIWIQLIRQDKKRLDNKIRFTLLTGIGSAEWDVVVDEEIVAEAIKVLN